MLKFHNCFSVAKTLFSFSRIPLLLTFLDDDLSKIRSRHYTHFTGVVMFFQKQFFFGLVCLLAGVGVVQSVGQIKPPVGIRQNTPDVHAFTNARIVVAPGIIIEKGTLVVRDGIIVAVGKDVAVPADPRVWDMSGKTLYPGLIESYSDIGVPKKPQQNFGQDQQQKPVDKKRTEVLEQQRCFVNTCRRNFFSRSESG